MHPNKLIVFAVFIFCTSFLNGQSEPKPFTIGQEYVVKSEVLGEDRPVLIYTPEGYEEGDKKYPVLYLLDGRGHFHHTSGTVNFLARNGRMPQMIVVGIPNTTDRTRDLTPKMTEESDQFSTAGGADNMLDFMEKELFPWVESAYRTEPYKVLVGHSFGGLFAVHALINRPGVFNSYLAISPSLWWDNQELVKTQSEPFFEAQKNLKGHLYMTMGNEGGTMIGGAWKLIALLKEKGPEKLVWEFDRMIEQTHGSIPHLSTYKGLEFIFSDWSFDKQKEAFLAGGSHALKAYKERVEELYNLPVPMDGRALVEVGNEIIDNGNFELAVDLFRMATEVAPDNQFAWNRYGECLVESGDKEKARKVFRKAYKIDSTNIVPIIQLKKLGEDVSDIIPDVKVPKKKLAQYAGEYNFQGSMRVMIGIESGKLWMEEGPGIKEEKQELVPIADNTFYYVKENARIEFKWKDKEVISFKAKVQGQTFVVDKVK